MPLGLNGRLQQGQFFSFALDGVVRLLRIILQTALCFGQAPLGRFASGRLGKLGPDLLDRHSHLERRPVRLFQFRAQSLEPFSTLVEAIAFGGHRRLSPLELGLPFLAQLNPGIALAREFLFATGQVGFAPLLLIGLERMFPVQRLFTFFDQRPDACASCSKRSRQAASRASRSVRSDWCWRRSSFCAASTS